MKNNLNVSIVLFNSEFTQIDNLVKVLRTNVCINHIYLVDNSTLRNTAFENCDAYYMFTGKNIGFGANHNLAIQQGCILLAPNLPYVKAVVRPNYFFDMNKPNSLVETIKIALKVDDNLSSKILIKNEISILKKLLLG